MPADKEQLVVFIASIRDHIEVIPLQIEMLLASLPDGSGTEKLGINESVVDMIRSVSSVLKDTTNPESRTRPLFPRDLNTTNNFLDLASQYVIVPL